MFKKIIFSAIALSFITPASPGAAEYFKIKKQSLQTRTLLFYRF